MEPAAIEPATNDTIGVGQRPVEVRALKQDSFGRIALMRDAAGEFVRRDLRAVPAWLRLPAWWLARREARALQAVADLPDHAAAAALGWPLPGPQLHGGEPMYLRPPRGDAAWFRAARRLLQATAPPRPGPQRPGQGSQLAGAGRRPPGD
jgi:hypothetical protein